MSPFRLTLRTTLPAVLALGLLLPSVATANPVVPGFNSNTLPANDDGSTGFVPFGFTTNFFGTDYTGAYINNNGNITFNSSQFTYTPFGLTGPLGQPIIAPFFADVDTRGAGSGLVTYGAGTFNGNAAFGINWPDVGYYGGHTDKLNNFQLLLVSRPDLGAGDFDIIFNYGQIQWETGDASGGSGGFGGFPAVAGYSNGTGDPGTNYQLPGSGVSGAFEDTNTSTGLIYNSNVGVPGRFVFEVINGQVVPPATATPEPASLCLFSLGLLGISAYGWRRRK